MQQLRAAITKVISSEACSAEFFLLLDVGGESVIKRADIVQSAQDELTKAFVSSVRDSLLREDLTLLNLSGADDRSNVIYKYDIENVPPRLQRLSEIIEREDFETFDFTHDDLSNLKGILVLLGDADGQLALYKHQYPVALMKPKSGLSLIRTRDQRQRFERVTDDILKVYTNFEFFKFDGEYYIVDIHALERFFGFHEVIKNIAVEGIANITGSGLLESTDILLGRVDDISFARKLVRAARNSPVLGVIPNEQVVAFVTTHPALSGRIAVSDDGTRLKLNTKVSQDLFLKLLNDDFLQSELTKRYYASLAKDSLEVGALA